MKQWQSIDSVSGTHLKVQLTVVDLGQASMMFELIVFVEARTLMYVFHCSDIPYVKSSSCSNSSVDINESYLQGSASILTARVKCRAARKWSSLEVVSRALLRPTFSPSGNIPGV